MMELDSQDTAFVNSIIPTNAVATGLMAVVTWLDPEDGTPRWWFYANTDETVSSMIGLLEMSKQQVLAAKDEEDDDDD